MFAQLFLKNTSFQRTYFFFTFNLSANTFRKVSSSLTAQTPFENGKEYDITSRSTLAKQS